ncbi:MAG: rhodanese-like domain-containing protein [Niabella sp.]
MNTITVQELKQKLDNAEQVNLIDCREPAEYEEYNIGGRLIPLGRFQAMDVDELDDLKDEEVIVHCRSGKRSAAACAVLDTMGFSKVYNLDGGVLAWKEAFDGE